MCDSLGLLQVRVHVGFVSPEAGRSLFLLLLRHDLQRHLHLALNQGQTDIKDDQVWYKVSMVTCEIS